jgi:hypothetical protein
MLSSTAGYFPGKRVKQRKTSVNIADLRDKIWVHTSPMLKVIIPASMPLHFVIGIK